MPATIEKTLNDLAVLTQRTVGKQFGVEEVVRRITRCLCAFCDGPVAQIYVNDGHRLFASWTRGHGRAGNNNGGHYVIDATYPWCRAAAEKRVIVKSGAFCGETVRRNTIAIPAICHVQPDEPMRKNEMTPVIFHIETEHGEDDSAFLREASMLCRAAGTAVMAATTTDMQRSFARAVELMTDAVPGQDNTRVYSAALGGMLEAAMKWYPLCTHYNVAEARDDCLSIIASNEQKLVGTQHPLAETASGKLYTEDALRWHYYFDYGANPKCRDDRYQNDAHFIAGEPSPNRQLLQEIKPKSQLNFRIVDRNANINLESHEANAFGRYAIYYVRQAASYLDELLAFRHALERGERQLDIFKTIVAATRFSHNELHQFANGLGNVQAKLADIVETMRREEDRRRNLDARVAADLDRVGDAIRNSLMGARERANSDKLAGERYVDPVRILRQIKSRFTPDFKRHGIEFTVGYDALPSDCTVDYPNLSDTIHELLTNVLKHSRPREARPLKCRVTFRVAKDNGRHIGEVCVRDNGVGVSSIQVATANGISSTSGECHGLGRIRQQLLAFGGRFRVASRPTGGTQVSIHVPIVARKSENQKWRQDHGINGL